MSIVSHFIASLCDRWFSLIGQHLCKFVRTKEIVCIRKESNPHRICLEHQYGRRLIVLELQFGHRDVMLKRSMEPLGTRKLPIVVKMPLPV